MYKRASDKSCELWLNTNDDDDELLLVMTTIQRSPTSEPLKICHCSFSSVQIIKSKKKQISLQSSVIQDVFVLCLVARALTCPEDREIVQIPLPAAAKAGPGAAEESAGSSSAASRKRPLGNDAATDENAEDGCVWNRVISIALTMLFFLQWFLAPCFPVVSAPVKTWIFVCVFVGVFVMLPESEDWA